MFGIGNFFSKIQGAFAKEVAIRSVIKEIIAARTGMEVPVTSITFKSETVMLSDVSQSLRSLIYIKKQTILKDINEKQNARIVKDIR